MHEHEPDDGKLSNPVLRGLAPEQWQGFLTVGEGFAPARLFAGFFHLSCSLTAFLQLIRTLTFCYSDTIIDVR
jgi:hypothetical protein